MKMYEFIHQVVGNGTEAEAFATANNFGTSDRIEIAKKIAALELIGHKSRVVIITQGPDDVIVLDQDGKVSKVGVIQLDEDKVIQDIKSLLLVGIKTVISTV